MVWLPEDVLGEPRSYQGPPRAAAPVGPARAEGHLAGAEGDGGDGGAVSPLPHVTRSAAPPGRPQAPPRQVTIQPPNAERRPAATPITAAYPAMRTRGRQRRITPTCASTANAVPNPIATGSSPGWEAR